ncbi:MAG: nicotinate-nucleotide adenylyltransferase [Bryobacterales bacterium]|nr:nicotinate-nucleotide adenylyltransferase [Bryobacterales bacterium]
MSLMRLGLFGGTFDPIHNAHLAVARAACASCQLDEVWFIPNNIPPHKVGGPVASWEQRFAMVSLACAEDARFRPSRLEERERTSYTIHTLRAVRAQLQPDDELFFLIGADAFADIGSWYQREAVFCMVTFVVLSRPGHAYEAPAGARTVRLETLQMDVSSSSIRQQLANGDFQVPVAPAVLDYISMNNVYGAVPSDSRFHTASDR